MFSKVTTPTGAQVTTFARFSFKEDCVHSHSLSLSESQHDAEPPIYSAYISGCS